MTDLSKVSCNSYVFIGMRVFVFGQTIARNVTWTLRVLTGAVPHLGYCARLADLAKLILIANLDCSIYIL